MAFRDRYHSFAYSMRANFHQRIAVAVLVGAVLLGGWHARQWWKITQSIDASAEFNLLIDAARNGEDPTDWSDSERARKLEAVRKSGRTWHLIATVMPGMCCSRSFWAVSAGW